MSGYGLTYKQDLTMCNPKIYASKFVAFSISMNLKIKTFMSSP
jgi:hypothetical protein